MTFSSVLKKRLHVLKIEKSLFFVDGFVDDPWSVVGLVGRWSVGLYGTMLSCWRRDLLLSCYPEQYFVIITGQAGTALDTDCRHLRPQASTQIC